MRLKRLELSGFKSFVDPTKIELGHGINAIVGPNGCGKSNIVDAIRWVLGEHSARHLRGGVMDDLIFQGSETRPPVAVCDVELTFAVQRGKLAPPYHDMDEIRIRRRLIRDGGSDAFINGKMARLKDIVDLFLDTGVSTRAYAIVEQGSIARMITAKPEERRQLLEEAAGVMKYRSRRKEAERKMNSTRQNMDRIEDLLEEVRSQCRSLKQQSSRAERFKTMQNEFEHAQSKTLAIRFQQQEQQLLTFQKQLEQAQQQVEEEEAKHIHAERVLTQSRRAGVLHDEEVQQAQEKLRMFEQQRASLQQQAERSAGERRLLLERKDMLQQRLDENALRQEQLQHDVNDIQTQLREQTDADLQKQRSDAEIQLHSAQDMLQEVREKRDVLLRELEQLRSVFNDLKQRHQQAELHVQHLLDKQTQHNIQLQQFVNKEQELQQALADANKQAGKASQSQKDTEIAIHDGQINLNQCREKQQLASSERQQVEQVLRGLNGEIQEFRAQLEQNNMPQDLRQSIRDKGGLWVDENLDVPEGMELAVAAVLRGQEGDLCLPKQSELSNWKAMFQQAKDCSIAIHIDPTHLHEKENHHLATHLELATTHPLFMLFSHASLCDDIFTSNIPKYGCLVSRDGWRLEPDGWLIPPAKSQTARRLSLKRRLQVCESERTTAEKSMRSAEQAVDTADAALTTQQQQWQSIHLAATQAQSETQAVKSLLQRLQDEQQSLQSRHKQLQKDAQESAEELEHWEQQLGNIGAMDEQQLTQAQQALDAQSLIQQQYDQQWQQARSSQAHAEQALALHKQTVQSLERDQKRIQQELDQLQQRRQQDAQQYSKTEVDIAASQAHADLDMQLDHAHEHVEAAHRALTDMRQQGHALQKQLHQYEHDEQATRKKVQQASEAKQQAAIRQASEQARLQDLDNEIEQRCQLSSEQLLMKYHNLSNQDIEHILRHSRELEDRLSRFGPVNLLAIDEFKQASEREQFLAEQVADLETSLNTLHDTISRIDRTTRQRFKDTFEKTNAYFKQTFPRLFGGGRAELKLDSDDILTAGVEVIAQPPGKRLQDITLLSGGEKALTAVALVFSIFRINPAPFCILDEVDAPLDDANVARFADMIAEFCRDVQFLAISHNKITMLKADQLIGVSMPEPGVSRIVSVDMSSIPE